MKMITLILGMIVIGILVSLVVAPKAVAESFDQDDERNIGYEFLLENGSITETKAEAAYLHTWNDEDDYFFNMSSGIQLTNHFNEYWTHNIFCGGYENNGWNWFCNSDLEFIWSIESDNETYVNYTGYRDISVTGKKFRITLSYLLNEGDTTLNVRPSIKNTNNKAFAYDLGFKWRIQDIQINMNQTENKYILDGVEYDADGYINFTNSSMINPEIYIYRMNPDNITAEYLSLSWDEEINYSLSVKNESGQYNAPAELTVNVGQIGANGNASIDLYWIDEVLIHGDLYATSLEHSMAPPGVFVNKTTGYAVFASDTGSGDLVWVKSEDGGVTWGAEDELSSIGQFFSPSVWYDGWTPGDTGDIVHIVGANPSDDSMYYFNITASTSTKSAGTFVYDGGALATTDGGSVITKSTTGRLYAGGQASTSQLMYYSDDDGETWSALATGSGLFDDDDDFFQLMPLSDGDLLVIYIDTGSDIGEWAIYNATLEDWQVTATTFIADTGPSTDGDPNGGATINKKTQDIYFAWNLDYSGGGDFAMYKFSNSTRAWTSLTSITGDAESYQVNLISDDNNGDLYAVYADGPSAGNTDVTWRKSTDDGATWGDETQISTTRDDLKFVKTGMTSDQRLYAFWYNEDLSDLLGETIVNITPTVSWSVASLDIGDGARVDGNLSALADIITLWTHTDVAVVCQKGDCGNFSNNWTTKDSGDQTESINFTCINSSLGTHSAIFNVSSNEDIVGDLINVSCEFWEYGILWSILQSPTDPTQVTQYSTFTLNATVNCTGTEGAKCGTVYAHARYNSTGTLPDQNISIVAGDLPMYINGSESIPEFVFDTTWSVNEDAGTGISGITTNNTNIWTTDGILEDVFVWDMDGGFIGLGWSTDEAAGTGLYDITTNGTNFWTTDLGTDDVYMWDNAGNLLDSWSTNEDVGTGLLGITTNNTHIWTTDSSANMVSIWDMAGNHISSWSTAPNSTSSSGIFNDGEYIWTSDFTSINLYKWDMEGNWIANWSIVELGGVGESGMTTNGTNFWITDSGTDDVSKWNFSANADSGIGNPQTSPETLEAGESWTMNWTVNYTDSANSYWEVDVLFNSSYGDSLVPFNRTLPSTVFIPGGAGDTCDTATWDCTENCDVEALDVGGATIRATGSGRITIVGDITNCNVGNDILISKGGCQIINKGGYDICLS